MTLEFIAAVYNEEERINGLIDHIWNFVDKINICDDGSTDDTFEIIKSWWLKDIDIITGESKVAFPKKIVHTGLPETVKAEALKMCQEDSWVMMLDADERFAPGTLYKIEDWINSEESEKFTHVWFNLDEAIDGRPTRHFQKCRLFRKSAASFSDGIHIADTFTGAGANYDWTVLHHKTSAKQIQREREYLETYNRLVNEGKMTPQKREELKAMHYFIR